MVAPSSGARGAPTASRRRTRPSFRSRPRRRRRRGPRARCSRSRARRCSAPPSPSRAPPRRSRRAGSARVTSEKSPRARRTRRRPRRSPATPFAVGRSAREAMGIFTSTPDPELPVQYRRRLAVAEIGIRARPSGLKRWARTRSLICSSAVFSTSAPRTLTVSLAARHAHRHGRGAIRAGRRRGSRGSTTSRGPPRRGRRRPGRSRRPTAATPPVLLGDEGERLASRWSGRAAPVRRGPGCRCSGR